MRHFWERTLAALLSFALLFGAAVPSFAAEPRQQTADVLWEQVDNSVLPVDYVETPYEEPTQQTAEPYEDTELVRVYITLTQPSAAEAGYSLEGIGTNRRAISYRARLSSAQKELEQEISARVLDGEPMKVALNLTLLDNAIAAELPYGKIEAVKALPGVEDVVVEEIYYPAEEEEEHITQTTAAEMLGVTLTWANGYTGAGSRVAVLDTGLDKEHELFDEGAFRYAIEEVNADRAEEGLAPVELLTREELQELWPQLNAASFLEGVEAEDVFYSDKVPFLANYYDGSLNADHMDSATEHGSHVAGIAVGNRYVPDGEGGYVPSLEKVLTQGIAPDAQLIVIDIFSAIGTTSPSAWLAGIEDAIVLGCSSVNLSMGNSVPGHSEGTGILADLEKLTQSGIVVTISAGNDGSWSDGLNSGKLYSDGVNFNRVNSPGSYLNSFAVASVDNNSYTGTYIKGAGRTMMYTEDTSFGNEPLTTLSGNYEFVYVDGIGVNEDLSEDAFAALGPEVLAGKIAICNRGESIFSDKANAAVRQGAIGVLIANNISGAVSMALGDYEYTAPVVSILKKDGEALKASAEAVLGEDGVPLYYTGTLEIVSDIAVSRVDDEYYTMSEFSSWGIPERDLILKPEITAPGGHIYSANGEHRAADSSELLGGHDQYEMKSGTSMAAPQVAGMVAVAAQYLRDSGLLQKAKLQKEDGSELPLTARQLIQSLLMSTAVPVREMPNGSYASVMKQGAGLADLDAFVRARSFLWMDESATVSAGDGKIKAELGDDEDRTGAYSVKFSLYNLSDEETDFDLSGVAFTQAIEEEYLSFYTDELNAAFSWKVNGETLAPTLTENLDFDGDGMCTTADGIALLAYVVGTRESISHEELADRDQDGDVDTYDAYLALKELSAATVTLPANGKLDVEASFVLPDMEQYDVDGSGAYVEAYLFVSEQAAADGTAGVRHSIPVIGYYGSWQDSPMFDRGTYADYVHGVETREPYLYSAVGDTAYQTNALIVRYPDASSSVLYTGDNPVIPDETYHPERAAISPTATIYGIKFNAIRNGFVGRLFIRDGEGKELLSSSAPGADAPVFYSGADVWLGADATTQYTYYSLDSAENGARLTVGMQLMTYYYYTTHGADSWAKLPDASSLCFDLTVDREAPVVEDVVVNGYHLITGSWDSMQVKLRDDRYVAAVRLFDSTGKLLAEQGSDPEAEAGSDYAFTYEPGGLTHFLLQVFDYAGNLTTYRLNINPVERTESASVTLNRTELELKMGDSVQLTAEIGPWGVVSDPSVTWTTANPAVATVSNSGVVTAVGAGETEITATSVGEPSAFASCKVTVTKMSVALSGILRNSTYSYSATQMSWIDFDLAELPAYTVNATSTVNYNAATTTADGKLYGMDYNQNLYEVNPESYEATLIGRASGRWTDMAAGPNLSGCLVGVQYGNLYLYDIAGNSALATKPWSGPGVYTLYGIAYAGSGQDAEGQAWDYFYLTANDGKVYLEGIALIDGEMRLLYGGSAESAAANGGEAAYSFDNSVFYVGLGSSYCNGEYLLYAYNGGWSGNYMYIIELATGEVTKNGYVLPTGSSVVGLYEKGKALNWTLNEVPGETQRTAEPLIGASVLNSVNSAPTTGASSEATDPTAEQVVITLTADRALTNGLYTVSYPDTLILTDVSSATAYHVILQQDHSVRFGFASTEGVQEGETLLRLSFTQKDPQLRSRIELRTLEENETHPDRVEELLLGGSQEEHVCPCAQFEDMPEYGTPEHEAIDWAFENGYTSGVSETLFGTGKTLTRAQAATFLYAAAGKPTVDATANNPFSDVPAGKWYTDAVLWAASEGLVSGYADGTFRPNGTLTRGQILVIFYARAGKPAVTIENPYSDVPAGKWYTDAALWAYETGIEKGDDGVFAQGTACTRETFVLYLYRVMTGNALAE